VLPAGGRRDLFDRGALGTLEQLDQERLLGAGAGRGLVGRCSSARLGRLRLGLTLGRLDRCVAPGELGLTLGAGRLGRDLAGSAVCRRGSGVGLVLRDADRRHAFAGDHDPLGLGLDDADQAAVAQALHHLGECAARELEGLGQRQNREIRALGGGAEDDGLGVAELGHGMISIAGEHRRSPTSPSPGGWSRAGRGPGDRPAMWRARPP
jgi:hypothetical protein